MPEPKSTSNITLNLIVAGIFVFLVGEYGSLLEPSLRYLIFAGLVITVIGIVRWFKHNSLREGLHKGNLDWASFFINKIVLKLWALIFLIWILASSFFTAFKLLHA